MEREGRKGGRGGREGGREELDVIYEEQWRTYTSVLTIPPSIPPSFCPCRRPLKVCDFLVLVLFDERSALARVKEWLLLLLLLPLLLLVLRQTHTHTHTEGREGGREDLLTDGH